MMLTEDEKEKVLVYLRAGEEIANAPGYVQNHATGEYTRIELTAYSDGTYDWSSEDIYNLEENDVISDKELIEHILYHSNSLFRGECDGYKCPLFGKDTPENGATAEKAKEEAIKFAEELKRK